MQFSGHYMSTVTDYNYASAIDREFTVHRMCDKVNQFEEFSAGSL